MFGSAPGRNSGVALPCDVVAGILPGGMAVGLVTLLEDSGVGPGGKMPPSTAGKMPAATRWRCPDAPLTPSSFRHGSAQGVAAAQIAAPKRP